METRITAKELETHLSDILSRVRYHGERFVVERDGEPVASLGPVVGRDGIELAELDRKIGHLLSPGEGFGDDLEQILERQPRAEVRPWPS